MGEDDQEITEEISDVFEVINKRRTVREFEPDPITTEELLKIIDAARMAPTSGNVQPWKFVVLQYKDVLKDFKETLQGAWEQKIENNNLGEDKAELYKEAGLETIEKVMTAPVYVLLFVNTSVYPEYALMDGCLAAENLMLAARALGYGTGFYTSFFPKDTVSDFVDAPEDYEFICAIPIGVPKEWPEEPTKRSLKDMIVYDSF